MTLMRKLRETLDDGRVDWGDIAGDIKKEIGEGIYLDKEMFRTLFTEARTFIIRDFEETNTIANRALKNPRAAIDLFRLPYPITALEMNYNGSSVVHIIYKSDVPHDDGDVYGVFRFQKHGKRVEGPAIYSFQPSTLQGGGDKYPLMIGVLPRYACDKDAGVVAGSAIAIIGAIAVINSPAVADQKREDYSRLNASRAKKGLSPIEEFHTISIKKHIREALKQSQAGDSDATHTPHWRRGHFKARKSGIYWWNPHVVGASDAVDVDVKVMDYKV